MTTWSQAPDKPGKKSPEARESPASLNEAVSSKTDVSATAKSEPRAATDLVILVPAPSGLAEKEIQENFKRGLQNTEGAAEAVVAAVSQISQSGYQAIAKFIGGLRTSVRFGDELIEPASSENAHWNIEFRDPYVALVSMELTYRPDEKAKETKAESFEAGPKDDDTYRLRFYSPGRYVLRLEPGWQPVSYKLRVKGKDNQVAEQEQRAWPAVARYFMVRITGFRGKVDGLLATMRDKDIMGTAFVIDQQGDATTLLLGSNASLGAIEFGPRWRGNKFVVQFKKPEESNPSRIWMLFPINAEEIKAAREQFRNDHRTPEELAKAISGGAAGYKVCHAEEESVLTAGMKPLWFEIPLSKGGTFTREFTVADIAAWKSSPNSDQAWQILAYQFDPPKGDPLILRLVDPKGKVGVLCLEEDVPEWPIGLKKAGE